MDGRKLDWALRWAARGFKIFPLRAGTKQPAFKGWPDLATRDEPQIRAWWSDADYNIGVLTDDMIVVDIDMKKGKNGVASLMNILGDYDDLDTLTVASPSGGKHAYYTGPNRSLSVGRLGDGLDIRSFHGYVIAPGSYIDERLDPTAGCSGWYTLERDLPLRAVPVEILSRLDAPIERAASDALVLDQPAAVDNAVHFLVSEARPAVEGQGGDQQTLKVALWLRDLGLSEDTAHALMLQHYNARCAPPWDADELRAKIGNAYKYGAKSAGANSAEVGFAGVNIPAPERIDAAPTIWFRHGDTWDINQAWLYYELLPAMGVIALTAMSQAGKTFLLIALARSLATGQAFFDVEPDERGGTIFLFAGSEGTDFEKRVAALEEDGPLPISATRVSALGERGALTVLLERIREEAKRMLEVHGVPLRMVVLETLSASGLIEDEDSNAQAAAAIANLEQLSRFLGVPILFSHHPPKGGQGSRGAGAIINNADYHLEVRRVGTENVRTLWLEKARGASQRRLGAFTLVPVELGTDQRGRKVVSMKISTGTAPTSSGPKEAMAQLLMECVDWAIIDAGVEIDGRDVAPYDEVHAAFKERKPGSKDSGNISKVWKPSLEFCLYTGALEDVLHEGERYLRKRELI